MATNDIYQLTIQYDWNDQVECKNVFYYQQTDANPTGAEQLNLAFAVEIYPKVRAVAPTFIDFNLQEVVNVRLPTDYYVGNYAGAAGLRDVPDAERAPSFLALQYVSDRLQPGTRSARKRFPFLYETDINGNTVIAATSGSAPVLELGVVMSAPISNGGRTFRPVVVKRPVKLGTLPTVQYIIPNNGYKVSLKVSTQNSRKD